MPARPAASAPAPTGAHAIRHTIPPRSGAAFTLARGQRLTVIDPEGEQVADLLAFSAGDTHEVISSGRSLDYASRIFLTTGDALYSNRSNVLLRIVEDTVGRHDFLLTPCSADTFRILYDDVEPHHGCFGNLVRALAPYGIGPDRIPVAFNVFMNVTVDGGTGELAVRPPLSRAGDRIVFEAETDLIIGLTACSAPQSNNFAFKPIQYSISDPPFEASAR
ncbi:urea carboxylase-associated family protein [Methylobacterium nigriterrae]|uniref:urea carboxylase-associated family protein n=1 Tax=Methylobacterium nigriterrae TaxID=3127512 RepID=UPI0030138B25